MKQISAVLVMVAFIVSTLSVPMALADESVVGIVYRGWSDQECKSAFGNYPYIISNVDDLGITDPMLKDARGPLVYQGQESGCYCGKEPNANQPDLARNYVMSEEKTSCVMCSRYDRNAVYYTDGNATDAVVKVKDKDIGCRCAAMEGVSKTFDKLENGKCIYKDATADTNRCQAQFGPSGNVSGVKVCTVGATGETSLGRVPGQNIDCCCASGYNKEIDYTNPGGFKCAKLATGATAGDSLCAQAGKNAALGDGLVECSQEMKTYDYSTASESLRQQYAEKFMGGLGLKPDGTPLVCCCGAGYIKSGGKCVKDIDECGQIVPGSVKQGRGDAGTIKVGDAFGSKQWEINKTEAMRQKGLACYCRKSYIPMDSLANPTKPGGAEETVYVLDSCSSVSTCGQAALGSVPSTDPNADPNIKVGPGWEQSIINTVITLNLNCSCPNGTIAYNTPGSPDGNDVCAFNNMRCMDSNDLSNFMYVGICTSQMNSQPFSVDFSEKGPVGLVDYQDLSVKNAPFKLVDIAEGILYGVARAMGVRDLWYGARRLAGCTQPTGKDDFVGYTTFVSCLASYPCDVMPTIDTMTGLQSGILKLGGQVYFDTWRELRIADQLGPVWETKVGEIATKLDGVGASLREAGDSATWVQSEALKAADAYTVPITPEFTRLSNNVDLEVRKLSGVNLEATTKIDDVAKDIAELEKTLRKAGVPNADVTNVITKLKAGETQSRVYLATSTEIVDDVRFVLSKKGPITLRGTPLTGGMRGVADLLSTDARAEALAVGATRDIRLAVTGADEGMTALAATAKSGSRWWTALTKKVTPAITRINDIPVVGIASRITLKSLKWTGKLLGWVGLAYSVIDGVSAAVSRTVTTDLDMSPGHTVSEVQTDKPFVVKASKASGSGYDKLYAVKTVNINLNAGFGVPGNIIDLKFTSDTLASPPPIEGVTYKCTCTGSTSCGSDKRLSGCTCFPIANSIEVTVGSKNAISMSGI